MADHVSPHLPRPAAVLIAEARTARLKEQAARVRLHLLVVLARLTSAHPCARRQADS